MFRLFVEIFSAQKYELENNYILDKYILNPANRRKKHVYIPKNIIFSAQKYELENRYK